MKQAKECADRLYALADEDRLLVVQALRSGPKNVSQIADELQANIKTVSHQLNILDEHGIVEGTKDGRFVNYRLHPDVYKTADSLNLGCCKLRIPT
jgi:DNA-binding transcriptional ArsR family regulator